MKNIFLINGMKKFAHSNGALNNTLHNTAKEFLTENDFNVKETIIEKGYDMDTEVEHMLWADAIIYQAPGWWMGLPWIVKKWIDDVFTHGHGQLYTSDGRTRSDTSKKYGSGGLMQGKKYMLSLTWNAPLEAFEDEDQFFHGVGVDGVYLPLHKANQFIGLAPLKTFICNDVMKNPKVDEYIANYKSHLKNELMG